MPTTEKTLLTFIAYLYKKGLSHSALNVYVSAIRNLNIINGHQVQDYRAPRVKLALKAVFEINKEPSKKAPITWQVLPDMWSIIEKSNDTYMWQSLISLAFFGSMRVSEHAPESNNLLPTIACVSFSKKGDILNFKVSRSKIRAHGFVCSLACSKPDICALCCMVTY